LAEAVEDVLRTLERLNYELNGPVPSQGLDHTEQLPRRLAYALAEIMRWVGDSSGNKTAASKVEIAWNAVLAGDIDDLREHVQLELAARRT
jgi:hypothetical protein